MPAHLFEVGQTVIMTGRTGASSTPPETYQIVATMPETNDLLQYRIRSENERYERVAVEDSLETLESAKLQSGT
ncbi:hypothetical protein [Roseibium algae]|uniref:Uncharacterized protein n=1 Tax=Roseibium algae TaxID=3123038 RepID=A0ABU8TH58_9HYPH